MTRSTRSGVLAKLGAWRSKPGRDEIDRQAEELYRDLHLPPAAPPATKVTTPVSAGRRPAPAREQPACFACGAPANLDTEPLEVTDSLNGRRLAPWHACSACARYDRFDLSELRAVGAAYLVGVEYRRDDSDQQQRLATIRSDIKLYVETGWAKIISPQRPWSHAVEQLRLQENSPFLEPEHVLDHLRETYRTAGPHESDDGSPCGACGLLFAYGWDGEYRGWPLCQECGLHLKASKKPGPTLMVDPDPCGMDPGCGTCRVCVPLSERNRRPSLADWVASDLAGLTRPPLDFADEVGFRLFMDTGAQPTETFRFVYLGDGIEKLRAYGYEKYPRRIRRELRTTAFHTRNRRTQVTAEKATKAPVEHTKQRCLLDPEPQPHPWTPPR